MEVRRALRPSIRSAMFNLTPGICSMEVVSHRKRKMCSCTIAHESHVLMRSGQYSRQQLREDVLQGECGRRRLLQRRRLQRRRDCSKLEDSAEKASKRESTAPGAKECVNESCPFLEWYSKDFIPNAKKLREREGKTGKVLLILDNAPCHPPVEIFNAIDDVFSVIYLTPSVTALLQPRHH
ncbi:jerky-like protein [Trichonephila clavipes]|nr:jerky-like protein [Trichonephila clavipes]